jgi:phage virion morphogenesis protein
MDLEELMFDVNLQGNLANFDKVAKLLGNPGPALGQIGGYLERKAKLRFNSQTAPDGKNWAPLKPSTLRTKKTRAILRETSAMVNSIAFRVAGDTVVVKPSVDYALYHQVGTSKMVARPFMGFEPGDAEAISKILADYITP